MAHGLSVPLACLLALVLWTVSLVLALTVVRLRHLKGGGSVRDFGVPDDRRLVWLCLIGFVVALVWSRT